MKSKHIILVVVVLVVLFVLASLPGAISGAHERSQFKKTAAALQSHYQDFATAAEAFSLDWKTNAGPVPLTVTLDELVSRGYLRRDVIPEFSGSDVIVSLTTVTTNATHVSAALVRVRRSGARDIVLAGDGSVFIPFTPAK